MQFHGEQPTPALTCCSLHYLCSSNFALTSFLVMQRKTVGHGAGGVRLSNQGTSPQHNPFSCLSLFTTFTPHKTWKTGTQITSATHTLHSEIAQTSGMSMQSHFAPQRKLPSWLLLTRHQSHEWTTNQSNNQNNRQSVKESIHQPPHHTINQPVNQPANQLN